MKKDTIKTETRVRRNPEAATRVVGETLYVFDDSHMVLHTYNDVGSFIWGVLKSPKKVSAIVAAVASSYDVSLKQAEKDVIAFIQSESGSGKLFAVDNR